MLKWLMRKQIKATIENELADARLALSAMRLKLHKEGSDSTRVYGEGIGETAGLLAQRFKISVPRAIEARGLTWQQLDDAATDLSKSIETMRPHLKSELETVRTEAHKATAGGTIFFFLYRLRFLATQAADDQKTEVATVAEAYADFARIMAEIGAGIRDSVDATVTPATAKLPIWSVADFLQRR
jgi:hypothetical protein